MSPRRHFLSLLLTLRFNRSSNIISFLTYGPFSELRNELMSAFVWIWCSSRRSLGILCENEITPKTSLWLLTPATDCWVWKWKWKEKRNGDFETIMRKGKRTRKTTEKNPHELFLIIVHRPRHSIQNFGLKRQNSIFFSCAASREAEFGQQKIIIVCERVYRRISHAFSIIVENLC